MPGYVLLESTTLRPVKGNGIEPYSEQLGFLDFLRELAGDPFPFPRFAQLCLVGLEEILDAARPEETILASEIHHRLREVASEMERRLLSVHVVFRGRLVRGDTLWSEFGNHRLPIGRIFGSPPPQTDPRGNRFFAVNFNLTNA